MNVVLEEIENCEVVLRVEVPAERVNVELKKITSAFMKEAKLPGFRPGKAPRSMIESKYGEQIKEELRSSLVRETLNEVIKEKKLRLLSVSDIEEITLSADHVLSYTATIVQIPNFELPNYENIQISLNEPQVTDEIFEVSLERLREPHASYTPVEGRGVEMGDFAVVSYECKLDGVPSKDVIPHIPSMLNQRTNFWIEMKEPFMMPGFLDEIVGMVAEETKTFSLTAPADFGFVDLQGKTVEFVLTLHSINTKTLPEWDEELAERIAPGKTLEEIRNLIRENLDTTAKNEFENQKRHLAMQSLLSQVSYPLPQTMVKAHMNSVLKNIVQENQARGISEEELRKHEGDLLKVAKDNAESSVRSRLLLMRIAEKENITVTQQELIMTVMELSQHYNIPMEKLLKDLRGNHTLGEIQDDIRARKAMDFIVSKLTVTPLATEAVA